MLKVFNPEVLVFDYTTIHALFDITLLQKLVFLVEENESMLEVANVGIQNLIVFVKIVNQILNKHQIISIECRQLCVARNPLFHCLS